MRFETQTEHTDLRECQINWKLIQKDIYVQSSQSKALLQEKRRQISLITIKSKTLVVIDSFCHKIKEEILEDTTSIIVHVWDVDYNTTY